MGGAQVTTFELSRKTPYCPMKKLLILAVTLSLGASIRLDAQQVQVKVEVSKIEVIAQKTPEFQAGSVANKNVPRPREWVEAEVSFSLDVAPRDSVAPRLDFRYFVGVRSKSGTKLFTGDIRHVNVEADREIYSVAYVAPSTVGKATGDYKRVSLNDIVVGVEVSYDGRVVASGTSAGQDGWWKAPGLTPEPGVLAKGATPFALLWLDRYPDSEEVRQ